ncbi:MAG: hypothetical protein K2L12_07595 [Clostridia bacterium]|nr:hypothetical protein [Clostridia bacterium]
MKFYKLTATKKLFLLALCAVFMSCLLAGYTFFGGSARAAAGSNTTAISALYDFNKYCYDETSLNSLAEKILGNGKKMSDLVQAARDAGNNGRTISNRELTVEYGRYRSSPASAYRPLIWIPVYLSKASSGDSVLTLYLAETAAQSGTTSAQETYQFSHSGAYVTATSCAAPTNSYGTSHMRSVTLGNLGNYATYNTSLNSLTKMQAPTEPKSGKEFKFSDFITTVDGVAGLLTEDLVTPSNMAWQANESAMTSINASGTFYDSSISSNVQINTYSWPNEAYGTPSSINYYQPGYFDYSRGDTANAKDKTNYDVWKNDKVWLPSLSEVGTGNLDGNNVGYLDGIWKLDNAQRGNNIKSWLRTACTSVNKTQGYSTYTMFATAANGSITTADVGERCGIRPAIHLNLTKISKKTIAPISLPDEIVTTYNGEAQRITVAETTVDPKQLEGWWKNDGSMFVTFYVYEEENQTEFDIPVAPLDSGTYYMVVELLNSSSHFLGEPATTRWKATKFTIKKIQLDVIWEYDIVNYNQPKSVKFADESKILDRDVQAGLKPEIGMMYSYYNGSGLHDSKEFPEFKGEYYATAYILNDDLYNYNYEISNSSKTSGTFTVKEKNIDLPYFLESGPENGDKLKLTYRGGQYVQIANASKYVKIELTKVVSTDTAAESKVQDLGVINDVHTFIVESVGAYVFKATLPDPTNTQWITSTEDSKDTDDRELELTVDRAEVTVTFEGLPSSWDTNTSVSFSLNVLGAYESTEVEFRVYYRSSDSSQTNVSKNAAGKYEIKSGVAIGSYDLFALVQGQIGGNYYMKNNYVSQKFTVYQAAAEFGSARANWQYVMGESGSPVSAGAYNLHNTPQTALEVENTGELYKFSMVWSETRFTSENLKATYSGDKAVKDAGLYSVTVVISAYNKNVSFTDETYTIYFKIKKKALNLSALKWDYSGTPFTYNGKQHMVGITADSLALVPGLTVDQYTTNGDGINAGNYTTAVTFIVSDSNYEVPSASDSTSYTGTFSFTCDWVIDPQKIIVSWTTGDSSSNLALIPTLLVGGSYVNYSYEHLVGGNWVATTSLTAETVTETYRVSAALKPEYANNYILENNSTQEFSVESGKQPVVLSYEINDEPCDNNDQFTYTGTPFNVKPVVNSNTVSISSFTVEYFTATGGIKGTSLGTNAPVNVGTYAAVVTVTFNGGYLAAGSGNEIYFEVVKADMDISSLLWTYTHTTVVDSATVVTAINAYFKVSQGKWVDANSGAEVNFAFEFDGTEHKLTLVGEENYAGKINISDMKGYSGTNVNKYTINVDYTYDDNNYNDPQFPKTLEWEITKANTKFNNIRWGYIDEDGNEFDFDLKNDAFIYTRVADGDGSREYKYSVGLINLPSYLKSAIKYYTTPQTVTNGAEQEGNAFSAEGVYHTRYTFSGYAGDANHNPVASLPSTIDTFVFWEIGERALTSPNYNNDWTEFDDKTHDLIALCNMPEEEMFYFHVDITFRDSQNNITKNYDGTSYFGNNPDGENFGGKFIGYHAGVYTIYFSRIMEIDGVETDIYFASVEVEVAKQKLYVVWDTNGSIPAARVKGVYVSDIIDTVYTNTNGGPVKLEYVQSTDGVTFYAQPAVSAKYSKNIDFEMEDAENVPDKLKFTTYKFTVGTGSAALDKPVFENDGKHEYTGNRLTFNIDQWYQQYEQYLYISDGEAYDSGRGEAYATEMGEYHIVISFKKDADAYWKGTDGNRDPVPLVFYVVRPTRVALDFPVFNEYSADYTGSPIEFRITNWMVLNEYLDYEVFYAGVSLGKDIDLKFVTAGIYTLKFTFKTDGEVTGYWKSTNDSRERELQLEIVDPNNRSTTILNPTVENNQAVYTGSEIEFNVNNWESYYSKYIELTCSNANVTISGGTIKATNVGSYTIVAKIKAGVEMTFANLGTEYSFTVAIIPDPNMSVPLEKPTFVSGEQTYTGSVLEFRISEWESIYSSYIVLSCDNPNVEIVGGVIRVTQTGNYTVTVTFKDGANATWADGTTQSFSLPFSVKAETPKPGEPVKLELPTLTFTEKEYTGKDITFVISNWDSIKNYVTILEGEKHLTQTAVKEYTVTLKIKNPSAAVWSNWEGDTYALTFKIKKAKLTVSVGEDGKPVAVNGDGENVDVETFFEPHYYDPETGEEVTKPEDGKQYDVRYTVKNEEEFNKCIENYEEVRSTITNNTYNITYVKPKGLSMVTIITIAAIAFVVLLFLVLVIVIAIRRRNAYYDDEYYDDDYDDYDDYDDDDEYYDDEY